jgi:hypothetical protein
LFITTTAAAPSEICDAEPAVMVPESRLEAGERLRGGVGANALVLGELDRIPLALRDLHRHHLVGVDAVFPCRSGLLVRLRSELVLLGAGEPIDVVALLGERTHRLVGEHVVQTVVGHVVEHGDVAILVARTAVHQQVWRLGHRLLATGDDDVELTGPNQLIREGDCINAGQTHLVDRQRGHVPADPGAYRRLAGGHLANARGQHLAHDHVLDERRRDLGLLERPGDRNSAKVTAREVLQRTHKLAYGSTCSSNNHRRRHLLPSGIGYTYVWPMTHSANICLKVTVT